MRERTNGNEAGGPAMNDVAGERRGRGGGVVNGQHVRTQMPLTQPLTGLERARGVAQVSGIISRGHERTGRNTGYLGWYDASKTQTPARRITDASRRYAAKHGHAPTVALVHPEQMAEVDGIEVRASGIVAKNTVYVGSEDKG